MNDKNDEVRGLRLAVDRLTKKIEEQSSIKVILKGLLVKKVFLAVFFCFTLLIGYLVVNKYVLKPVKETADSITGLPSKAWCALPFTCPEDKSEKIVTEVTKKTESEPLTELETELVEDSSVFWCMFMSLGCPSEEVENTEFETTLPPLKKPGVPALELVPEVSDVEVISEASDEMTEVDSEGWLQKRPSWMFNKKEE